MSVSKTRPLALIGAAVFSAGLMWATAGQAMEDEGMSHDQSMSKESMSHEGSTSTEDNIKAPTGAHGNSADETYQQNLSDDTNAKGDESMSHDSMSSGDSMSHDNMKKKDKM